MAEHALKIGDRVEVPWGLDRNVLGTVVEVWGDPPTQVRVQIVLNEDEEPVVLLLSPSAMTAA